MTNLRGALITNRQSGTGNSSGDITKDVSALGVVLPFTVTARIRHFASFSTGTDDWIIVLSIGYGGIADNLYQTLYISSVNNGAPTIYVEENTTGEYDAAGGESGGTCSGFSQYDDKAWRWILIEIVTGKLLI